MRALGASLAMRVLLFPALLLPALAAARGPATVSTDVIWTSTGTRTGTGIGAVGVPSLCASAGAQEQARVAPALCGAGAVGTVSGDQEASVVAVVAAVPKQAPRGSPGNASYPAAPPPAAPQGQRKERARVPDNSRTPMGGRSPAPS